MGFWNEVEEHRIELITIGVLIIFLCLFIKSCYAYTIIPDNLEEDLILTIAERLNLTDNETVMLLDIFGNRTHITLVLNDTVCIPGNSTIAPDSWVFDAIGSGVNDLEEKLDLKYIPIASVGFDKFVTEKELEDELLAFKTDMEATPSDIGISTLEKDQMVLDQEGK